MEEMKPEVPAEAQAPSAPPPAAEPPAQPDLAKVLAELRQEIENVKKLVAPPPEKPEDPLQAINAEIESLIELELRDLPDADRKALLELLPRDLAPIARLKLIRGLKPRFAARPDVGARPPASAPARKEETTSDVVKRLLDLRKTPKVGRVPPAWEGR